MSLFRAADGVAALARRQLRQLLGALVELLHRSRALELESQPRHAVVVRRDGREVRIVERPALEERVVAGIAVPGRAQSLVLELQPSELALLLDALLCLREV